MEKFLNLIFNLSMIVMSIAVVYLSRWFKEDDNRLRQKGLTFVCIGLLPLIYWMYMTAPICSSCETRKVDRDDIHCSVCGDIWNENDLPYWKTKE